jgi:hypothetical protein
MIFQIKEPVSLRGSFRMRVYRKGALIERYEDHNLIVNGARNTMARLVSGNVANRSINRIAFGTNGGIPTSDNTAITSPYIKPVGGFTYPAQGQVEIAWNLLTTEANGKAILEFGLLCADGTLFARKTRNKPLEKDADIAIEGQWILIF